MKISFTRSQKKTIARIIASALLFAFVSLLPLDGALRLLAFLIPYFIIGWDVLYHAGRNIIRGRVFDENFLMTVASIGALVTQHFVEAAVVMLLYQFGEFLQNIAVPSCANFWLCQCI